MMQIEAVKKTIMQGILKSIEDYNNSIEILEPAVKKYFNDNYNDIWYHLYEWHLVDNGNNIEITYTEQYLSGAMEYNTVVVPLETIVSVAVYLSLNKKI
jgi:hypothetical protein